MWSMHHFLLYKVTICCWFLEFFICVCSWRATINPLLVPACNYSWSCSPHFPFLLCIGHVIVCFSNFLNAFSTIQFYSHFCLCYFQRCFLCKLQQAYSLCLPWSNHLINIVLLQLSILPAINHELQFFLLHLIEQYNFVDAMHYPHPHPHYYNNYYYTEVWQSIQPHVHH